MALIQTSYVLPLDRFSFDKVKGVLSAMESDLRDQPFNGTYPWLSQIWDDACDVGCTIRSHHTGKEERFYLEREDVRDGDLLAWYFKPVNAKGRVKEVVIFND